MSAHDKYSLLNRDNLTQRIQMQLSQKQKNFFWSFFCIFETFTKVIGEYEGNWVAKSFC